jgi:hypothetical protein
MVDFRTKLITLVGMTVAVAGMAFGQASAVTTLTPAGPNLPVAVNTDNIRAEGVTELVGSSSISVNAGTNPSSVTLVVYVGTGTSTVTPLGITSKTGEATASGAFAGSPIVGVISGTSVTFSNIPVPASPTNAQFVITISNIRVNSAGVTTTPNAPPIPVSVQYYLQGTNVTPAVTTPVAVAFAQNGLGAITSSNVLATPNTICSAVTAALTPTQYVVNVNEGFASSFKTLAEENTNGINTSTAANSGTRIMLSFANIPAGVAVYVPLTVTSATKTGGPPPVVPAQPTTISLATSGTGAPVLVTASTATGAPALSGAVTIANNTGTAVYVVTQDDIVSAPLIDQFPIPVTYVSAAGAVLPTGPATVTVSFAPSIAPTATATDFPSFNNAIATAPAVSGSSYVTCSTTLLFPYVLNPAGWETGLAISNTSLDSLSSTKAGGNSLPASQTGACVLSFFGSPTGNNPANFTTPGVVAGTTWSNTLTAAAGANFNGGNGGYVIANCAFQYAHGFAYIVNSFGTTSQMAMGYTAKVLPVIRPLATGAVETLGE